MRTRKKNDALLPFLFPAFAVKFLEGTRGCSWRILIWACWSQPAAVAIDHFKCFQRPPWREWRVLDTSKVKGCRSHTGQGRRHPWQDFSFSSDSPLITWLVVIAHTCLPGPHRMEISCCGRQSGSRTAGEPLYHCTVIIQHDLLRAFLAWPYSPFGVSIHIKW